MSTPTTSFIDLSPSEKLYLSSYDFEGFPVLKFFTQNHQLYLIYKSNKVELYAGVESHYQDHGAPDPKLIADMSIEEFKNGVMDSELDKIWGSKATRMIHSHIAKI